jgi:anti-anti-sigma factor
MSIIVVCPNGHELRVKSEFAGKSGLCPHCKLRIDVPKPEPPREKREREEVSEDDLLAVLGQPRGTHSKPAAHAQQQRSASQAAAAKKDAANSLPSSGTMTRKRVCPKCCEVVSVSYNDCPKCHTPLSQWTFPVPDVAAHEGRASYRFLGLRNHDGVLVVRFGEHRILDELTIKKFGDELFRAADRPDCKHLLLNFVGVKGLSSVMLGIMLMLRKKMSMKQGKIKLCHVGPEIMDVFHATKLGKLFEILDTEPQGLAAFG